MVLHELRYAIRRLRNSPGFSVVAVATLALAIGANAAMFSYVKGLFLSPLPYPEPDRIVRVLERLPSGAPNGISTLNYLDWASHNAVFEHIAAEAGWRATLTGADEPVVIEAARVSAHYFDVFQVKPAIGRTFLPDEDQLGKDRVVLLSHRLWESRFASDPAITERSILLNGEPHVVIGVLPKGPFDRAAAQIWKPLAFGPSNMTRDFRWLGASAKLKPGVTLYQAQVGMELIGQRLASAHDSNKGWGVAVDRLSDVLIGPELQTAVTVLFAATALVLLIGCANLANLTLARGISREREMAVRAAVGSSRARLARLFLIENVLLALGGGLAGVGVGYGTMKLIQLLIPPDTLPPAVDITMDASVLLFTFIVTVTTGLLLTLAPAAQTTNPNLVSALKEGGHGTTASGPGRSTLGALIVAEIALAFVLLVASGLLMRSFFKLLDVDPGFRATNVLTADLPIDQERHPDPGELSRYLASIRAAVDAVPGVGESATTSALPLEGWGFGLPYSIAGREATDRNRSRAFFKIVSPSYFHALNIRLLAGRMLNDNDRAGTPPVVLINESLASREFGVTSPIGHHILAREVVPGQTALGREITWNIVGVIAGERINGIGDETSAGMYASDQQSPTYGINLIIRGEIPPLSLQGAIRSAVSGVNKNQAISDVRSLEQIVDQSMTGNRVMNILFTVFASIALLLAALGIYGVMSYTATQRTREMGIRTALGATSGDLRALVFSDGMRLTMIGVTIGFAGTFAATRVMSSMLYGVGADDPLTIVVVAALLSAVAGLACYLPARRMAKVDPMEMLR